MAGRIDRLPAEEKRLLQTAAVIGSEVPLALLQRIAGLPQDALHRGLTHLQAAELLYETHLFPDQVYTFKHALTHEVAYGSLLQERRRVLHAQIVEVLETLVGDRLDEQVDRLAHHARRGEVWDKVVLHALANQYLGYAYHTQGDYHRAIDCFRQTAASLDGARSRERFGRVFLPAVVSHACLAWCHADQREQARAALSAAIALSRAMDMTFWLPQAEAALAQVA